MRARDLHGPANELVQFDSCAQFEVVEADLRGFVTGGASIAAEEPPHGDLVCADLACGKINGVCYSASNVGCPDPKNEDELNGLC